MVKKQRSIYRDFVYRTSIASVMFVFCYDKILCNCQIYIYFMLHLLYRCISE